LFHLRSTWNHRNFHGNGKQSGNALTVHNIYTTLSVLDTAFSDSTQAAKK
jgi:hypothetical protein